MALSERYEKPSPTRRRDNRNVRAARYIRWAGKIERGQGASVARLLRKDAKRLKLKRRPKK